MKIQHTRCVTETLDLSEHEVNKLTIQYLKQLVYPADYMRTEKGKLVLTENDPYFHGSMTESYVRDATENDIAIFTVLKILTDRKFD